MELPVKCRLVCNITVKLHASEFSHLQFALGLASLTDPGAHGLCSIIWPFVHVYYWLHVFMYLFIYLVFHM